MCKAMEDMRRESWEEGIQQGRKEGIEAGRKEGIAEGIEKGIEKGIETGRKEGIEKAAIAAAKKMLADGTIALEKIAEFVGLSTDEVKNLRLG